MALPNSTERVCNRAEVSAELVSDNRPAKLAYVFPGQGSQQPGMGKDLAQSFAVARELFEEADQALGFSISRLCFEGPAEALQQTENTQPAILAVSVAAWRVLQSEGFTEGDYVAGHSLGEYSALVAAGTFSFADAIRTVRARGRYMQEAVALGVGAMAAVIGARLEDIETTCAEASQGQVCAPANINSPTQVVIAGHTDAVERAIELLKQRGAKRAVKLNVSAPFHCSLMKAAQERLAEDLDSIQMADAKVPVISNVDARARRSGSELRAALVKQVSSPVLWQNSVSWLLEQEVHSFIEVGPGKVLSGLLRQIDRQAEAFNVEDTTSLAAAREKLIV
jgi:[acyl-carrier-protein] S-malonyltransferase